MPGRQLAADLPELLEVVVRRALRRFDAEWRVSARAADARDLVAPLDRIVLREELLEAVEAAVDERLRQLVVADDREAVALEAAGEVLDERRRDRASRARS